MIPIGDDNTDLRIRPYVTWLLLAANVFVFGLGVSGIKPHRLGASSSVALTSRVFVVHGSPGVAGSPSGSGWTS